MGNDSQKVGNDPKDFPFDPAVGNDPSLGCYCIPGRFKAVEERPGFVRYAGELGVRCANCVAEGREEEAPRYVQIIQTDGGTRIIWAPYPLPESGS
jgi:hypothetical protein